MLPVVFLERRPRERRGMFSATVAWVSDERKAGRGRGPTLLIDDAAVSLGVSRRTVYYRIREGRLRTIRTRCGSQRVLVSSIEALRREGRGARAVT